MTETRRMSDAEIEQTIEVLVDRVVHNSPNRALFIDMMGFEADAAFRRLCARLLPEFVRWQAAEINDDQPRAARDLAIAAFAAWMIANQARNTVLPKAAASALLGVCNMLAGLMVDHAEAVPGAELNADQPERTT